MEIYYIYADNILCKTICFKPHRIYLIESMVSIEKQSPQRPPDKNRDKLRGFRGSTKTLLPFVHVSWYIPFSLFAAVGLLFRC